VVDEEKPEHLGESTAAEDLKSWERVGRNKMEILEQIENEYNLDAIEGQLEMIIQDKNVFEYLDKNLNWEIDNDLMPDDSTELVNFTHNIQFEIVENSALSLASAGSRFANWFKRSFKVANIRKGICKLRAKLEKLIDTKAQLKDILKVAISSLATVIGISINPMVTTIIIGLLATLIIQGFDKFCAV